MQTKNLVARAVPSIDNNIFSNIMTDRQTDNTAVLTNRKRAIQSEKRDRTDRLSDREGRHMKL